MKTLLILTGALLTLSCSVAIEPPPANLLIEGWKHRVWGLYPVEKVAPGDELKPTNRKMVITAARGESEPFEIVLRSSVPLRSVELLADDFKEPGGEVIKGSSVTVLRMGYVFIDEPSGSRIKQAMPYEVGAGEFADPLLPGPCDVRPGRNAPWLVTLHVPRDTAPGNYSGTLRLRFKRETWMPGEVSTEDVLPVYLKVRKFAMPERSPLLNTSYASIQNLPAAMRTPERLAEFHDLFASHQQTLDPVLPSPRIVVDADGELKVDSDAWEAAQARAFENGSSHLFVPVWGFWPEPARAQGLYFLWHYPLVTKQKWAGVFIAQEDKKLTPKFQRFFGVYLKHMHGVLERRGWLERAFITTMDEPYTAHSNEKADTPANNYAIIRAFVDFVRSEAPGLRTFSTANPVEGLNGYIDHWCLRSLDNIAAARQRVTQNGEVLTFCDNYRTFIDYPAVSARSLGWLAWKVGGQGWLTYETLGNFDHSWEGRPFVYPQFAGGTAWGLGRMFYPEVNGDRVLSSLRWEMMREGCDDYTYLWMLRQTYIKLPDNQRQTPIAKQAARLIGSAGQVVSGSGDAETTGKVAPSAQSNTVPHALREQIAQCLDVWAK